MTLLIVVVAAETVVIVEGYKVEGYKMLAEKCLRRRYRAGLKDNQGLWEAWNRRRLEAEAEGKEITEPPPTLDKPRAPGNRGILFFWTGATLGDESPKPPEFGWAPDDWIKRGSTEFAGGITENN